MKNTKGGFTLVEVVVATVIIMIGLDMGIRASGPVLDRRSVTSARASFAALHARARVRAVERGRTVRLFVDPAADSAWVSDGTEVIEAISFATSAGIDVTTESRLELCWSPRGYADTDCNSFTSAVKVEFARNGASSALKVRPLGQLVMED